MSRPEWLRTFAAIYRSGSVTDAAHARLISQPAASQQLRALERVVGEPLFRRTRDGVQPTDRGRELYAAIADPLARLESVLDGLDAGRVPRLRHPLRVGASAEAFAGIVLPVLDQLAEQVDAHFGDDAALIEALVRGELDVALTNTPAPKRAATSVGVGRKDFALVADAATAAHAPGTSLGDLGDWLAGRPWVSYSVELPITRRFWQTHLGRPFSADLRLTAADLRTVAAAVERGLGCSLLPRFACAEALDRGRMAELWPVGELVAPEPWFLCIRAGAEPATVGDRLASLLMAGHPSGVN